MKIKNQYIRRVVISPPFYRKGLEKQALTSKQCKNTMPFEYKMIENVPQKEYTYIGVFSLSRRMKMEYMTTSEFGEKWNISRRRVTKLCTEGRIEGAVIKGNTWLIPSTTVKPDDPRREKVKEK